MPHEARDGQNVALNANLEVALLVCSIVYESCMYIRTTEVVV